MPELFISENGQTQSQSSYHYEEEWTSYNLNANRILICQSQLSWFDRHTPTNLTNISSSKEQSLRLLVFSISDF